MLHIIVSLVKKNDVMCVFFVWPTFDSVSWIAYENQIMIMITLYISVCSYDVILFQDVLLYHPLMSRVKSNVESIFLNCIFIINF